MEEIRKEKQANVIPGVPGEEELKLISAYTRTTPDPEDVYTFSVILCDNDIDRDCECFSVDALTKLKELFAGVTGIFDHNMKSENQTARIFRTEVMTDSGRKTAYGDVYTYLKAWCYMIRTKKNEDLIREIEGGIKKEVSISCAVNTKICSACGNDMRSSKCTHLPGDTVDGKVCYAVLGEPTDAYEWSFVAVPAQRNAGVSKGFKKNKKDAAFADISSRGDVEKAFENVDGDITVTKEQAEIINKYIEGMKKDAEKGEEVRIRKEKDILALAAFTLPDMNTSVLASVLRKLDHAETDALYKAFIGKGNACGVMKSSLVYDKASDSTDDSQFRI